MKETRNDHIFFSGILRSLTIFASLSPIIQEFRKTQHNWYGTLRSYFKNGPHSKALKTLFLSKNEKKELWIVLALNMFMHYNHKRDFKGQCPTIQLWKKGHEYTKRERGGERNKGGGERHKQVVRWRERGREKSREVHRERRGITLKGTNGASFLCTIVIHVLSRKLHKSEVRVTF